MLAWKSIGQMGRWATVPMMLAYTLLMLESAVHLTSWQVEAVVQKHLIVSFRTEWPVFLQNLTVRADFMPPPPQEGGDPNAPAGEGPPEEGGGASPSGGAAPPPEGEAPPEGEEGMPPPVPPGPAQFCLYALGFADNYPIINDRCQTLRWRPGQAWQLDGNFTDGYQPIRIGNDLCLAVSEAKVSAHVQVTGCPHDSTKVAPEALWRMGRKEDDSVWFRNMRTRLCLRQHPERDQFTVEYCRDELEFYYKLHSF